MYSSRSDEAMTEVPHVSVVLPTYRRPEFLQRAVTSVIEQTLQTWELLIVDDNDPGSAERHETEAVVARYATDHRIRYLRHDRNRGGGAARNTGIQEASAPFVAFLDDDDEWDATKLERQLDCIGQDSDDVALVYCRVRVVTVATGRAVLTPTDGRSHSVTDLLRRNTIGTTSCVLCRRSALLDVGLFDESLPARQDQDLYLRLAQSYGFSFVDAVLVTLYVHGGPSISSDLAGPIKAYGMFYDKYRSQIDADPEIRRAMHFQQGKHLLAAERYGEARSMLVRAWHTKPTDVEVLMRLAMTFSVPRALVAPTKRVLARLHDVIAGGTTQDRRSRP
jgi:glycosyltransferase involved in cell wall biosynthesis